MSGLIIVPIFIFYVIVGFFLIKFILRIFKKKFSNILLLLIVILLPFWDLFVQKGVKTYYQVFGLLNPIVYEALKKNVNGKVVSFDFSEWEISVNEQTLENKIAYSNFKNGVNSFVEIYMSNDNDIKKKLVRLDIKAKTFEYITKPISRYLVRESKNYKYTFFGMVKISKTLIIERNKNKIIMEAKSINFTDKFTWFRRNYLLLTTGGSQSDLFVIHGDSGNQELFKKLKLIR